LSPEFEIRSHRPSDFGGLGVQHVFHQLGTSYVDIKANRIHLNAPLVSAAGVGNVTRLFAVALGAASLAACAQSSVVTKKSESLVATRQASLEQNRKTSFVTNRRVAVRKKHTPFASNKNAAETQVASHGLASFYTEGTLTASGEKFDTHELTAAHARFASLRWQVF
jgi:rare lipoprotein A